MYIKSIHWLDKICQEAEVEVSDSEYDITCFSQPCKYLEKQNINEPLECINVKNIMLASEDIFKVKKIDNRYGYMICGKLINDFGLIQIGSIILHIDESIIPKDIVVNNYVIFYTDRIDLW